MQTQSRRWLSTPSRLGTSRRMTRCPRRRKEEIRLGEQTLLEVEWLAAKCPVLHGAAERVEHELDDHIQVEVASQLAAADPGVELFTKPRDEALFISVVGIEHHCAVEQHTQDDPRHFRIFLDPPTALAERLAQRSPRAPKSPSCEEREQLAGHLVVVGGQNVVFRWEVIEERSLPYIGRLGDRAYSGDVVAIAAKKIECGPVQPIT